MILYINMGVYMVLRKVLLIFLWFFLVCFRLFAETILLELKANDVETRSEIANIIHLDQISDDRVFSLVSEYDFIKLKSKMPEAVISADLVDEEANNFFSIDEAQEFPVGEERFHTYQEMSEYLVKLENDFPHLMSLSSIGQSVEGLELYVARVSDDSVKEKLSEKKAIVYMATHHAREHVSTELAISFLEELLQRYDTDENIRQLLNDIEIYVLPMVNPDGAMYDIKNRKYQWWRKNRKKNNENSYGIDLNRNYSFGWGSGGSSHDPRSDVYMGTSAFSEPETAAIRDFFISKPNITTALSLHTFSELILYPWGGRSEGVGGADEDLFKSMAEDMANMNHYNPMQSSDLYIASGDTCDWAYGELKIICFTFELSPSSMWGGGFYPGSDLIDHVFADNWEPMIYLAKRAKDPRSPQW